jgi:2-amino-4-hydroxy-6-hydroxymethyldihydropteridine diphosphokinase
LKTVYLGIGSNLGDRKAYLRKAIDRLEAAGIHVLRCSSVYETEPQDVRDQPWFLNVVVEAETALYPLQLLGRTQNIELALGRVRRRSKGPRTLDIDILLIGDARIRSERLTVPHPALTRRRFVLEPLAEIAPDLVDPGTGRTIRDLAKNVAGQQLHRSAIIL